MGSIADCLVPGVPNVVAAANRIAADGGIAVVGRAITWQEHSPAHMEAARPLAFGFVRVPPPLLRDHSDAVSHIPPLIIADGAAAGISTRGLDCVWQLRDSMAAVDGLFDHILDGVSGLSVEMLSSSIRREPHAGSWDARWDIAEAELRAVAVVRNPSYPAAGILAIVTPDAVWTRNRNTGFLIPDQLDEARSDYIRIRRAAELADEQRRVSEVVTRAAAVTGYCPVPGPPPVPAGGYRPTRTERLTSGPIEYGPMGQITAVG